MTISTQLASSVSAKLSAPDAPKHSPESVLEQTISPTQFTGPSAAPGEIEISAIAGDEIAHSTVSFQLPAQLAQVFRAGAGDELSDFASYALTRFLLREHWVELEDCALLPFMVQMTNDVVDYQLAADAAAAVAQAEGAGDETALQVELDLGLPLYGEADSDEIDSDEIDSDEIDYDESDE